MLIAFFSVHFFPCSSYHSVQTLHVCIYALVLLSLSPDFHFYKALQKYLPFKHEITFIVTTVQLQ